jgi:hypothetical protein
MEKIEKPKNTMNRLLVKVMIIIICFVANTLLVGQLHSMGQTKFGALTVTDSPSFAEFFVLSIFDSLKVLISASIGIYIGMRIRYKNRAKIVLFRQSVFYSVPSSTFMYIYHVLLLLYITR